MTRTPRPQCPIAASLKLLGDRWTLVVLRDLLLDHRYSFSEIGENEGIATNVLQNRLDRLTRARIVERRPHATDKRRWLYLPTESAIELLPVLLDLVVWGDTHTEAKTLRKIALAIRRDRDGMIKTFEEGIRKSLNAAADSVT
jgi:DNA-binding HxlR family transcriptional regulator